MEKKQFNKQLANTLLYIIIMCLFLAIPVIIFGRPGGGHSYSGGSFDTGGGGEGLGILIWLLFNLLPPYISIPLIIGIFIYFSIKNKTQNRQQSAVYTPSNFVRPNPQTKYQAIENLKKIDPNFSRILFLDFVSLLYNKYHFFVGDKKKLNSIAPFFKDKFIIEKVENLNAKVSELVVGNIDINSIEITDQHVKILTEIVANYSIKYADGKKERILISERWLLIRDKNVLSLPPEKMQSLSCPYCGAPANFNDAGYCEYCGNLILPGKHQWFVENIAVVYIQPIKGDFLVTYAQEVGTEYPTVYSPDLDIMKQQFSALHNKNWQEYWQKFNNNVVKKYFFEINKHWSNLTWEKVRHLLTDRLWESYNFWIETYKEYGLKNKTEDVRIDRTELVKIEIDKYYEAFTVRIFARALDYTVDKKGKIVGGNNKTHRKYSEYWTFIRRKGVEKDDYDISTCPNCGAPIEHIGQNGVCNFCGAKITTGEYSWVLALVVQDEEYKG